MTTNRCPHNFVFSSTQHITSPVEKASGIATASTERAFHPATHQLPHSLWLVLGSSPKFGCPPNPKNSNLASSSRPCPSRILEPLVCRTRWHVNTRGSLTAIGTQPLLGSLLCRVVTLAGLAVVRAVVAWYHVRSSPQAPAPRAARGVWQRVPAHLALQRDTRQRQTSVPTTSAHSQSRIAEVRPHNAPPRSKAPLRRPDRKPIPHAGTAHGTQNATAAMGGPSSGLAPRHSFSGCIDTSAMPSAMLSAECAVVTWQGRLSGTAGLTAFAPAGVSPPRLSPAQEAHLMVGNRHRVQPCRAKAIQPLLKMATAAPSEPPPPPGPGKCPKCKGRSRHRFIRSTAGCDKTACSTEQADSLRAEFFGTLNQRRVRYAVLWGYDQLPLMAPGSTLDLLFAAEDEEKFSDLLTTKAPREGSPLVTVFSDKGTAGSQYHKVPFFTPEVGVRLLREREQHNNSVFILKV